MHSTGKKTVVRVAAVIMGLAFTLSVTPATASSISAVALAEPQASRYAGYTEETMKSYFKEKVFPMAREFFNGKNTPGPHDVYFIDKNERLPSKCENKQHGNERYFYADAYAYCPTDGPGGTVYLGQEDMWELYSEVSDVAPIISLAHEWGHAIQKEKHVQDPPDNPAANGELIHHENQADCVAGSWIQYALQQGWLKQEDLRIIHKLVEYLARIENVNREHGNPDEREGSMWQGIRGGLKACNSFYPKTPIA